MRSGRCTPALGTRIFDAPADSGQADGGYRGTPAFLAPVLAEAGLPATLADALDDTSLDAEIRQETGEALALTGKMSGHRSSSSAPRPGVAFFGPVISRCRPRRKPSRCGTTCLAGSFPGFAESQAQPAGAASAAQLRCRNRPGRNTGRLARREPARHEIAGPCPGIGPARLMGEGCRSPRMRCPLILRQDLLPASAIWPVSLTGDQLEIIPAGRLRRGHDSGFVHGHESLVQGGGRSAPGRWSRIPGWHGGIDHARRRALKVTPVPGQLPLRG